MASYNLTITKSGYNSVTCGITCDTTNNVCMDLSCVAPGGCSISGTTSTSSSSCTYSSGQTLTLKATHSTGDAVTAWSWSTSDSNTCSISPSTGSDTVTVTFKRTGSATISCVMGNGCGSCNPGVTVSNSWTQLTAPTVSSASASNWSSSGCGGFPGCTVTATASYTDGTGSGNSGSWSRRSGTAGTINSSTGVITFSSTGSVTVRYTRSNSCGSSYKEVTVSASWTQLTAPTVSSVSASNWSSSGCGNFPGCTVQATASYSEGTGGNKSGSWSIVSGSAGTVNSSGVITFTSTGTVTVRYTRSNDCGSDYAQKSVTASWTKLTAPTVSSVSASNWSSCGCGGFPGCTVQASAVYTEGTGGNRSGSWSIVSGSAASVNSSGLLTFTSTGTVTVRYTRSNDCGSDYADKSVTASWCDDDGPYNLSISGTKTTGYTGCTYSSGQTLSLSGSYTNGCCSSASYIAWSSSDESVCTVSNGTVTFKKAGNATIYYKVGNSCATATTSANVSNSFTQLTAPTVNSVTGNDCVCVGNTTTFSETHSDGTGAGNTGSWSSSNTGVATVNSSGVVTGVAAGTATIRYTRSNNCGSSYKEKSITVYKKSSSISISGGGVRVNAGSGVTLTGTSPQNSAATTTWQITSGTGTLSVSTGTSTVAKVTNTNSSITVKYTVTEPCSCGTVTASTTIYSYGKISDGVSVACSGGGTICCGSTATIVGTITNNVNASLSKSFSSNNTNLPVNSSTGVVSGNAANQTGTITCTVTDSYGNSTTCTQTVKTYPSVASVSISGGGGRTCCGSTVTLTGSYTSGISLKNFSWSSNNGNVVLQSGSSAGSAVFKFNAASQTATITYSVTSCDNVTKTTTTTVYSYPSVASVSISGGDSSTCCGSTVTLSGSYTSGISLKSFEWSSNNANVVLQAGSTASSATFKFNAANQSATITYKITSCDNVSKTTTKVIKSYPSVASVSISGAGGSTCCGSTVTLTGSYTSGISVKSFEWTSNNNNVVLQAGSTATSATFKFNAANQTATITYKITSCDNVSKTTTATVYSYPSVASVSIGGAGGSTCCGSTVTLSGSYTSGISLKSFSWSSNNNNVVLQAGSTASSATFKFNAANQTATITYKVTSCDNIEKSTTATVYSYPSVASASISGGGVTLCTGGTVNLTGSYTSGISLKSVSWSSSNANFTLSNTGNTSATVTATSGANGSSTTISYVVTSCDNISKTGTTTIYCYKNLASTSLGNPSNSVIYGGGSCKTSTIDYSYSPTDMSRGSDSLTLSNTAVASISYPAGTSGTATITGIQNVNAASSVDVTITYTVTDVCNHSLTKTKTITVRQHVTAATLDITSRTLCAGANETGYNSDVTLTAGFAPANAYGVSYSWATSDSSVASISTTAGGTTTVHGIKKGTATITLTATDGCGTSVTKTCSITVKNPNLTCLSASNITVTCGSTTTYTVEASPRKNVGNETTESIVNVTGWTATVTNGVDNVLGQGKINIAKSDKSGTFKGLTHGTGTTITITGQTVGLSDVTVTAVDDNGVSKTIVFRVLTKSTAQDDTTKIATRGWINTYRWPIFGSGEDLKKVPRKVDITNAVASGTVSGYLTISGTYENTQGVKESDLSVSMSSNNGKPSGDKC